MVDENQLVLLATNFAKQQPRDGTASSRIIVYGTRVRATRNDPETAQSFQEVVNDGQS